MTDVKAQSSDEVSPDSVLDQIERDNEGYFCNPSDWSVPAMYALAGELDIPLDERHLAIIHFIREYFEQNDSVPQAQVALRHVHGEDMNRRASARLLSTLFPYGYGQQACKLAGMRKPLKLMLDV